MIERDFIRNWCVSLHCADADDVIMVTTRPHLLLPHTMAPLPSCCSPQPATAVVTPPPLSSGNSSSSSMLDSVALDEAISNFRDVATSLDMTSGHGELLTDTQQYTAQLDDVNTSASYMIFCQYCGVQCMFAVQDISLSHSSGSGVYVA